MTTSPSVGNQAFLLLTNKHSSSMLEQFRLISDSAAGLGDAYIIYHQASADIPPEIKSLRHYTFTDDILERLTYTAITETLLPGSNHFPLLDFYLKKPFYEHYWYIEDDVRFNASWKRLFDCFTNMPDQPDFISSHIRTYQEEPKFKLWRTLRHPSNYLPINIYIRSFNPIYRISNLALSYIHDALVDKWQGHHEVLLATLLYLGGFRIADFGGAGMFVLNGMEDKFYSSAVYDAGGTMNSGTMRYRPVISDLEITEPKLYHPVKKG